MDGLGGDGQVKVVGRPTGGKAVGIPGLDIVAVKDSRRGFQTLGGIVRLSVEEIGEEIEDAVAPDASVERVVNRLDGLFRGLLAGKAGPLVIGVLNVDPGAFEVALRLAYPVLAPVRHGLPFESI